MSYTLVYSSRRNVCRRNFCRRSVVDEMSVDELSWNHIRQGGTGTEALRQAVLFPPKRGGINSCLKESIAWVQRKAYNVQTYPSLPLAASYLLPLAVTPHLIRSASFPSKPYTLPSCLT